VAPRGRHERLRHRWRAQCRHKAALQRLPREAQADFADDAQGRLDDERRMRGALRLLGRLPRREQEVFTLCAWAGLGYEEAATALRIPVGTVRSRLSRARARLRELPSSDELEWDGEPAVPAPEVNT
jgi:RNA polymerase sigma factor (sigma-70 family)